MAAQNVQVRFLGAGDAFNSAGRFHASYLVSSPSACFLLDCGPTVLMALKRDSIDPGCIDAVFLSHLHGDHFAGLPFLFIEWLNETRRRRPFFLVGPPGTRERVHDLIRAMYRDLASRRLPFDYHCVEVQPREATVVSGVELFPFRVPHQETEVSLGLKVRVDGKTILYSGDTGWTEELVVQSQGTDLFICECCFFETRVDYHLDYPRLREHHRRFGCRRLVLTHIGREVLARRDEIELEIASDGMVVSV